MTGPGDHDISVAVAATGSAGGSSVTSATSFARHIVLLLGAWLLVSCGGGSAPEGANAGRIEAESPSNIVMRNDEPGLSLVGKFDSVRGYLSESAATLRAVGPDTASATFELAVPRRGFYEVFAWWPQAAPPGSAAQVTLNHLDGQILRAVDQSVLGGQWNSIGIAEFDPSRPATVTFAKSGESPLIVDAVRFHFVGDTRPALELRTELLPIAEQDVPFAGQLDAVGGVAPYSFRVTERELPPGLELARETGLVTGIPAMKGSYEFIVEVTDAAANRIVVPVTIEVTDTAAPASKAGTISSRTSSSLLEKSTVSGTSVPSLSEVIASLPEGEWAKVNVNDFSSVWTPAALRPLYFKSNPEPSKIILAWSSFAWDTKRANIILYGGGHANYRGNDVYFWRSATRQWERAALPSEMRQDALGNWNSIDGADNAPASAHTYDNSIYLPVVDRFLTLGGAADSNGGRYLRQSTATTSRVTGPYLFDPSRAHPDKVGGTTGSHVQRVAPYPEIVGGNMWSNRDLHPGSPSPPAPGSYASGCTGYATENGKDVVYLRTLSEVYRYTINDLSNPGLDTWEKVGRYWSGPGSQATCAYDPVSKALVRTATNAIPFVYWDINTAGSGNRDVRISLSDPGGEFSAFMASKAVDISRCALDFDPQRRQFALWCGDGRVWMLEPPATLSANGWTVRQQRSPVLAVPNGDFGTGILGKWKYIPNFDVFMGLQDSVQGNVWVYKPVGWQAPDGTDPGGSDPGGSDPGGSDPPPPNLAPAISITSPADGASFTTGQPILLSANASDSDGQVVLVEFYQGTTKIGDIASAPFQIAWQSPPIGSFSLTAVVTDNQGARTVSAPVSVSVSGGAAAGSVILQRGLNGFSYAADTYLSTYHKSLSLGSSALMQDGLSNYSMLARFAIFQSEGGPVPDGSAIKSAKLSLYKYSAYNMTYGAHRLLKPWDEATATWNQASGSAAWSIAGANAPDLDYLAAPDATASIGWDSGWIEFDVTAAVQQMSNGSPTGNHGWRIRGVSGNIANLKKFYTSEHFANPELRPKLAITFN